MKLDEGTRVVVWMVEYEAKFELGAMCSRRLDVAEATDFVDPTYTGSNKNGLLASTRPNTLRTRTLIHDI